MANSGNLLAQGFGFINDFTASVNGAKKGVQSLFDEITKNATGAWKTLSDVNKKAIELEKTFETFKKAGGGFKGLTEAIPTLRKNLDTVKTSFDKLKNAKSIFAQAGGGVKGLTQAFSSLGLANPILLGVIAAVAVLGAAAFLVYKNWDKISAWFKATWGKLKSTFSQTWNQISQGISVAWSAIKGVLKQAWNAILALFYASPYGIVFKHWDDIKAAASAAWGAIKKGVSDAWGSVSRTITDAVSGISQAISGLGDKAWNWGANLIGNLINGLKGKWNELKNTLGAAGQVISNFLGFSSPTKEGPGSKADKWAPNLVRMFADGIHSELPRVQAKLNLFVNALSPSGASHSAGSSSPSSNTAALGARKVVNNHVNIYPAKSQLDEHDLLRALDRLAILNGA